MMRSLGLRDLAGDGPAGALVGVHADNTGQQRGPDQATAAGARPFVQFGDHAVGAVHPGQQVRDRHADLGRGLRVRPGHRHQSGLTLRDLVVAGAATLRSVMAEAGDRQHHQRRVEFGQPRHGEAESVEHARPEVLQQHVTAPDEFGQRVPPVLALQVEHDRLLVAVAGQEIGGDRLAGIDARVTGRRLIGRRSDERWSPAAGVVAVTGSLHLDHPGAEVGEHHRRVRPGKRSGQIDDGDVGQRSAVHGCLQGLLGCAAIAQRSAWQTGRGDAAAGRHLSEGRRPGIGPATGHRYLILTLICLIWVNDSRAPSMENSRPMPLVL